MLDLFIYYEYPQLARKGFGWGFVYCMQPDACSPCNRPPSLKEEFLFLYPIRRDAFSKKKKENQSYPQQNCANAKLIFC